MDLLFFFSALHLDSFPWHLRLYFCLWFSKIHVAYSQASTANFLIYIYTLFIFLSDFRTYILVHKSVLSVVTYIRMWLTICLLGEPIPLSLIRSHYKWRQKKYPMKIIIKWLNCSKRRLSTLPSTHQRVCTKVNFPGKLWQLSCQKRRINLTLGPNVS